MLEPLARYRTHQFWADVEARITVHVSLSGSSHTSISFFKRHDDFSDDLLESETLE